MSTVLRKHPLSFAVTVSLFAVVSTTSAASAFAGTPRQTAKPRRPTRRKPRQRRPTAPSSAARTPRKTTSRKRMTRRKRMRPRCRPYLFRACARRRARHRSETRCSKHPGQHHGGKHRRAARHHDHRLPAARHWRADQPRRRRGYVGGRARPASGRHHVERRSIHHGGSDRLAAARLHHVAVHAVPRRGRGQVAPPPTRPTAASAAPLDLHTYRPWDLPSGFTYSYSADGQSAAAPPIIWGPRPAD
jgi:hypothetical protein